MAAPTQSALLIVLLVALAGVGLVVADPSLVPVTPDGHRPLHINCPPGSHGKPRTDGVGRALQEAQDTARARRLEDRAITQRP